MSGASASGVRDSFFGRNQDRYSGIHVYNHVVPTPAIPKPTYERVYNAIYYSNAFVWDSYTLMGGAKPERPAYGVDIVKPEYTGRVTIDEMRRGKEI